VLRRRWKHHNWINRNNRNDWNNCNSRNDWNHWNNTDLHQQPRVRRLLPATSYHPRQPDVVVVRQLQLPGLPGRRYATPGSRLQRLCDRRHVYRGHWEVLRTKLPQRLAAGRRGLVVQRLQLP
jgi:hypothetical protein